MKTPPPKFVVDRDQPGDRQQLAASLARCLVSADRRQQRTDGGGGVVTGRGREACRPGTSTDVSSEGAG